MPDPYQHGSDEDWLQHSNAELAALLKKRDRQIRWLKFAILVLLIALGWVIYKFGQA